MRKIDGNMDKADVGIVILNYKSYDDTIRAAEHILGQKTGLNIFIQIVDNKSPNESYEVLKERFADVPNVDVCQSQDNGGYAKGNNLGISRLKSVRPKYILIQNNDIYYDISVLEDCVAKYGEFGDAGVIAPVQTKPDGTVHRFRSLKVNTFMKDLRSSLLFADRFFRGSHVYKPDVEGINAQRVDIVEGCFLFAEYDLMERISGFDESTFLFCEERFLYEKMRAAGRQNYILLDQTYVHDHSKTIKGNVSSLRQKELLLDGKISYTRRFRRYPSVKVALLKAAFKIYKAEYWLIGKIKGRKD